MADRAGPSKEKCDNDNEIDEKLNLYSEKFDPLTFLLSNKTTVPKPTVKLFDNIAMWYSHYTRGGSSAGRGKKPEQKDVAKRKWLPHQLPVATTKPARSNKNVILKMETMQGPLALLRKYTTERTRIKVTY
ncbi:hypothetical protein HUJ05_012021 [Dendroctonus ponderosae]|nr:hypothetical protein HUJ05_012021 [Dendroctonus ponderosae]